MSAFILFLIFISSQFFIVKTVMLSSTQRQPVNSQQTQTGKKIKNYIYNYSDQIGKGNFARVYRGINQKTQQIVAIKIVSLDALKSKRLQELIFEQIKILQQMNHPNILKFYEALLSDRNCYIITELCNQGDLQDRIRKKKGLTENEFSKIVADLYQGLKYLREMGVTHRDLKTANIFMQSGQAKIADFGLAKFYKEKFKDLDIGSPLYMSPEGLMHHVYGQKTDVWSFGIILYELLHGQTPFCGCTTQADLKSSVVKPLPDYKFRQNLHPLLKQLIISLLEINQFKRPTIFEVGNDPFIKGLLAQNFILMNQSLRKKGSQESPLFVPHQVQNNQNNSSISEPNNNSIPKAFSTIRPNSLQVQKNCNKSIQHVNSMHRETVHLKPAREQRKISVLQVPVYSKPMIQLVVPKVCPLNQTTQHFRYPSTVQFKPNSSIQTLPIKKCPSREDSFDSSRKVTVTFQQPMIFSSLTTPQQLWQRQFSQKTIQTKQSQSQKSYSMSGSSSNNHHNFHNY